MLPMQIESERNSWRTRLRQRDEKAGPDKQEQQQRRQAMEQCDEAARQMVAGKEEADNLIRKRKAVEGALEVRQHGYTCHISASALPSSHLSCAC